jgi:hypothetical protein
MSEQNMKTNNHPPGAILEPDIARMQQSIIIFRMHIRPYVKTW